MFEPVLTRNIHRPASEKIQTYLANGGYEAVKLAFTKSPNELIDMVKRSGLRGRGGAGFPAGTKWGFMPRDTNQQKIVAVNTDEGEPGTYKDREIVERGTKVEIARVAMNPLATIGSSLLFEAVIVLAAMWKFSRRDY